MIFQHTIDKVLDGTKTQTRRLVKLGEWAWVMDKELMGGVKGYDLVRVPYDKVIYAVQSVETATGRTKWQTFSTYAVQPGRNKKSVARIRLLRMWKEDVREISLKDVKAEGFNSHVDFFKVWVSMHDKDAPRENETYLPYLPDRPSDCYEAWALKFELI